MYRESEGCKRRRVSWLVRKVREVYVILKRLQSAVNKEYNGWEI